MKQRVLYVEDHPNNVLLVQRIVTAAGHAFFTAPDGREGWQMAVDLQPDLILMDLRLPGPLNGIDLTRRIKASAGLSHIPIITLTAYGHGEAETAALDAGCDGVLHKPADIRQIRQTLRRYLSEPGGIRGQSEQTIAYAAIF